MGGKDPGPNQSTRDCRKRFKNEIVFSERTRHPNLVRVVDHGVATFPKGPAPFYVMPRYSGSLRKAMPSLADLMMRLRYFDCILSGVEAAHLANVIHRDLKPENIFVERDRDNVVVGDFGIAHFTDEELYTAAETRDDKRLANFQYAAPEQRMRGTQVDKRADIYALGLLLNELFTGSVPHGTAYRTVGSVIQEYAWLDPLVESMLRQQPTDRPVSVEAMNLALIGHRQDYVTRQRLDELQNTVVTTTEITDPLALAPLTLVDFEWAAGELALILSKDVNDEWAQAFHRINYGAATMGKDPNRFRVSGNRARIDAREHEVQQVIDYFKPWLPLVTAEYRRQLENRLRQREAQERAKALAEQEELTRRKRLRESIKL
jgi:serine/threonine protein kinase